MNLVRSYSTNIYRKINDEKKEVDETTETCQTLKTPNLTIHVVVVMHFDVVVWDPGEPGW